MEELCTACLCVGRNLYYIEDTAAFDLYSQMLNEITSCQPSPVFVRLCWECRALLRRLQGFRARARHSYVLLSQLHQHSAPAARPPRLSVHQVTSISIPYDEVALKLEPETEWNKLETEAEAETEVKTEPEDSTHCEETFANDFRVDTPDSPDTKPKVKTKKLKVKKQKEKEKTVKKRVRKWKRKRSISPVSIDETDCDAGVENEDLEGGGEKEPEIVEEKENSGRVSGDEKVVEKEKVAEAPLSSRPQCAECGKVFSSRKTYRYHLNVLHKGQNRYPCPRCGKVYQWKSNLGRHMRTHKARDAGELYCEPCDKKFASVATYRQHLKISRRHVSENEFSFMCTECGKKFVNKTRLRDHVDWEHLNNIKFRCQLCNKPFKCHTSLYVHMQNVHRNKEKKDNLCHVCGKSYQNAAKLKYHIIAMHTHETPYRCAHCSAAFGWYSSLYRHIKEVHYKMKVQPKKSKRAKRVDLPPPAPLHAAGNN